MIVKDTGGQDYDPCPEGLHHAVCYGLVDVGTHEQEYKGTKYDRRIVYVLFELPHERIEINGANVPRAISNMYTRSLSLKANLRKDLESWRGKSFTEMELVQGFELKNILGANCQLNVVHNQSNGKTYANIIGIVPLGRSDSKINAENDFIYYDMEEGMTIPENCPEWLQKKIFDSREYNEMGQMDEYMPDPSGEPQPVEDIPF